MTRPDLPKHRHGKAIPFSIAFLLASSIVVLWSWNTVAVDLFAQPKMQFKHGFALMLLVFVVISVVLTTKRIFGAGDRD